MSGIVGKVQSLALALGAPGLFLLTFLDSSFLSFPEAADLLIIWMVAGHKSRMLLYAGSAVAGSVVGSLALFFVGRKGGEALVRAQFNSATVDRTLAVFQRHGLMAVLIPSLLPPPMPFKIFVLLAGVAEISAPEFTIAIAIGRGIRYFGEALLAVRYGEQATAFMHANGRMVSAALAAVLAAGLVAYLMWSKAGRQKSR
jgi:membrane protein YqaA with SNARE-associated domain